MTVRVRLFAVLRERAGRDEVELELDEGATVAEAIAAVGALPGLGDVVGRLPVRMAVNRDYADEATPLAAGDELALIPPVSGGAELHARVTEEPLSLAALTEAVGRPGAGAIVSFQGTTRDVDRLDYEAYRAMAEERMAEILRECVERYGLEAAAAEHRVGAVPLGEASVAIAVSAAHRGEAFAGGREAIDRIKAEAPIWKKEVEGTTERWAEGSDPLYQSRTRGLTPLTHLDSEGEARMVDVGAKPETERRALAAARLRMAPETAAAVEAGDAPKGDVLGTARLAGIQAAKRAADLVPLAHPIPLTNVDVRGRIDAGAGEVVLEAEARTVGRTGVEIEAMAAASVAALTVYDMVKGLERGVEIASVRLLEKSGGRSGEWRRGVGS